MICKHIILRDYKGIYFDYISYIIIYMSNTWMEYATYMLNKIKKDNQ